MLWLPVVSRNLVGVPVLFLFLFFDWKNHRPYTYTRTHRLNTPTDCALLLVTVCFYCCSCFYFHLRSLFFFFFLSLCLVSSSCISCSSFLSQHLVCSDGTTHTSQVYLITYFFEKKLLTIERRWRRLAASKRMEATCTCEKLVKSKTLSICG